MMLRWMLANLIRQAADRKISEAVTAAAEQMTGNLSGDESPAELPPCQIAVVFATNWEAEDFASRLGARTTTRCASFVEHTGTMDGVGVAVVETGVGTQAARQATEDVVAIHKPAWVVSAGFAGALAEPLRRGHVLMASEVVDGDGRCFEVGFRIAPEVMANTRGLHVGRLLTVQELLREPERRRSLGAETGALAFDMETFAVAAACRTSKTPFLSVRLISDGVDDRLPPEVEKMMSRDSWASKLGAATGAVFKKPSSVKNWWRIQQQGLQAADRLANFLAGVMPQLAAELPKQAKSQNTDGDA
jgi:adenosylhomocysteine nucleosidase